MLGGRWITAAEIDAELTAIEARVAAQQ